MNMKAFFEKFEIFADAPNAVAKMRELVLTLAVQGKLVSQDPNDEPAIPDLEKIESEKSAMIEARKLRPNRISEIPQTRSLQYKVPDSWRWFSLGDVAFYQEGPGIRNWQFRTEGIKLLNVQNIVDGKLVLENSDRHISAEEFESTYRHFAVESGDILFASSGGSWGKTAWFVDPGYTVMLNTSMVRLKFYSKRCVDAFLLLFLRTEFFRTQMQIQLVGIQPNFGSTHLGRVYIPLPPLAEQKRIVAKLDELMALCDRLEAQQQEREEKHKALSRASLARFADAPTPANLQFIFHPSYTIAPADLRKSILTLAVQGKLVPQDPKDEPAEELFNKIQKDDVDRSSLLKRNSSIVEPAEFHHDIPEHWVWCELQEISDFINGKAHEQFVTDEPGFALVNSRFVSNSGRIFKYSTQQLTPLFRGDIALVMSDVPDGRALARCFVVDEDDRYTLNQRIGCIRTSDLLCKAYLALVLDRNAYFLQYDDGKKQTNLKKIQIVSCPVPLPPLAEQLRIVAKVEELMKLVDALETQLATSRATAANLLAALVAELTGTPNTGKVSVPASTSTGTGRRGRPPKAS
jgi:type I restriction enzyme S subunit